MSLVAIDSTTLTTKAGALRPARLRRGGPAGYWTLVLFSSLRPGQMSLEKSDAACFDFVNGVDELQAPLGLTLTTFGRFENLARAPTPGCPSTGGAARTRVIGYSSRSTLPGSSIKPFTALLSSFSVLVVFLGTLMIG